jgi:hypothetical protein
MQKGSHELIKNLSKHLFWDVDCSKLNPDSSSDFIVGRVLGFGVRNDWQLIKDYYGLERIKEISLRLKELDDVTLAFLSGYFDLDKNQFLCYKRRQSAQNFWNY